MVDPDDDNLQRKKLKPFGNLLDVETRACASADTRRV